MTAQKNGSALHSGCLAEVWMNSAPDHQCTRPATHWLLNKEYVRFRVCWQHARTWKPYGLWIMGWGWLDVSQIASAEPAA